jgi:hypothetical protein
MRISLGFAVFASIAVAQTYDRVLQFQQTDAKQDMLEIATLIQTIADIPSANVDEVKKTLSLGGDADSLALGGWLFNQLDQPAGSQAKDSAVQQYTLNSGADNIVRIFYLPNTPTVQSFQEVATMTRTIGDIRRAFTYNSPRALVLRGSADQIALADWLVNEIDRGVTSPEYRMPATSDARGETSVRLFHVANAATVQDFQEVATAIRTVADVRRVFTYNSPKIFAARGTTDQIALTGWLLDQIDKAAIGQPGAPTALESAPYDYQTATDPDNVVKVFYLHSATVADFQYAAIQVRTQNHIRRVFTYNAPRAMVVRGTVDQIASAERMVKDIDQPAQK